MHLCVFLHSLADSGAQRRTVTLVNGLAGRGARVDLVVVARDGLATAGLRPEVRVIPLDVPPVRPLVGRRPRRGRQMLASVPALAACLDRERPDVLLSAASHAHFAALLGRRRADHAPPLVLRVSNHLSASSWNRVRRPAVLKWLAARAIYRWADAVIAVSEGVAEDLTRRAGIPRERITVIPNPVVTPDLLGKARLPLDHPWAAPDRPPLILAAGRLVPQKDFGTLVRAFARLRAHRPARLVILGEGRERGRITALAVRLGVGEDVALPGFTDNPFAWMSHASLFVLSSAWEGLPGVLVEAMACGCPVVSTDCRSGPREVLDGGACGRLVPVGDAEALAAAMLATLGAPPPAEVLIRRAEQFAEGPAVDRYARVLAAVARRLGGAVEPVADPWPT